MKRNRGMDSNETPISKEEREALKKTPGATAEEKRRERERQALKGQKFRASQEDRRTQGNGRDTRDR